MTDEQIIQALKRCGCHTECCYCNSVEECGSKRALVENCLALIARQKEEKEHLEYVLMAVMHSVDKWLEGDELKQDEANRACTMREKTLKITEKLQKKIDGLQKANQEGFVAIEKRKGEIERLNTSNNVLRKSNEKMFVTISKQDAEIERLKAEIRNTDNALASLDRPLIEVKSEAYKEFAEKVKDATFHYYDSDIDNILKELTEGGNEPPKNDFKE